MMISKIALAALIPALVGCGVSAEQQARMDQFQRTIPICNTDDQCNLMWQTAQAWVANNAAYQIQIATDTVIQTFNPTGSTTAIGARVVKEPLGSGSYRIVVSIYCDNLFGCMPDAWTAAQAFNNTVNRI